MIFIIFDLNQIILTFMSERESSEQNYPQERSPPRSERPNYNQRNQQPSVQTERQPYEDSPTKHDVDYYVRKVNRYEAEIARIEQDLSLTKYKLSRAQDFEIKYEQLFQDNQKTISQFLDNQDELQTAKRQLAEAKISQQRADAVIKSLNSQLWAEKNNNSQLVNKKDQLRNKSTSEGQSEREALKQAHNRQIDNLKKQNRDLQQKLKRQISQLKGTITFKETVQNALANKLEHIKKQKNSEIDRLKTLVSGLRDQLGQTHRNNGQYACNSRNQLITETEQRIRNVRTLGQQIQQTLAEEINNLNEALTKKNNEITFLLQCDKKQLNDHQNSQNSLKTLVHKLQDKIFQIQRTNELELYKTINRLKSQYEQNLLQANAQWEQIRLVHSSTVDSLKSKISEQKKEIQLLIAQNRNLQGQHKNISFESEHSMQMLSQKIINMEVERDNQLKNYTTSMKQIQDDAKTKLDDLHTAIQNKNSETQILQAQLNLKNGQISHLLEELSRLREVNRQKMKKLQNTNAAQQNSLNNQISSYKKQIFDLKRNIHQLQSEKEDQQAEHNLSTQLHNKQLQSQQEANELLKSKNTFLTEWCTQLERDLKAQRVSNVNILHDQNISHRENVQLREEVRVELTALKEKQIEQIRSVYKLDKNRLQSELTKREHELRDKKEQLSRLLVQYKSMEAKIGKSSKVDRSAEDQGKCRATLQAQILLSQNIFNAINRQ